MRTSRDREEKSFWISFKSFLLTYFGCCLVWLSLFLLSIVVKLFNAIRAAQGTTTDDVQAAAADSEGTKPMATLPGGKKQNALGGKESACE